eukprot:gnl/Chilomastix_cuspidata/2535.p1 GENE.gnl/Chilomastix_cuspidata/2535~~gnl/Chilomastix_cuspidata/2535.p1  ORF type:complete len:637 (-),score=164.77 gnl/Chilomastix_cuspidata/2535:12-1886(-)
MASIPAVVGDLLSHLLVSALCTPQLLSQFCEQLEEVRDISRKTGEEPQLLRMLIKTRDAMITPMHEGQLPFVVDESEKIPSQHEIILTIPSDPSIPFSFWKLPLGDLQWTFSLSELPGTPSGRLLPAPSLVTATGEVVFSHDVTRARLPAAAAAASEELAALQALCLVNSYWALSQAFDGVPRYFTAGSEAPPSVGAVGTVRKLTNTSVSVRLDLDQLADALHATLRLLGLFGEPGAAELLLAIRPLLPQTPPASRPACVFEGRPSDLRAFIYEVERRGVLIAEDGPTGAHAQRTARSVVLHGKSLPFCSGHNVSIHPLATLRPRAPVLFRGGLIFGARGRPPVALLEEILARREPPALEPVIPYVGIFGSEDELPFVETNATILVTTTDSASAGIADNETWVTALRRHFGGRAEIVSEALSKFTNPNQVKKRDFSKLFHSRDKPRVAIFGGKGRRYFPLGVFLTADLVVLPLGRDSERQIHMPRSSSTPTIDLHAFAMRFLADARERTLLFKAAPETLFVRLQNVAMIKFRRVVFDLDFSRVSNLILHLFSAKYMWGLAQPGSRGAACFAHHLTALSRAVVDTGIEIQLKRSPDSNDPVAARAQAALSFHAECSRSSNPNNNK